ncbi:hypothetical protein ACXYN8_12150 [Altererythrobacter sp. CAU 1778]
MRLFLRASLFVWGLFFGLLGLNFLVNPGSAAAGFGLMADGSTGLATLRADMTAFFLVSAVAAITGAWRYNGDILLVPAALFGVAFFGRLVSIFGDGTGADFWQPMAVEALSVVLMLLGAKFLPHHHSLAEAEAGSTLS